MKLDSESIQSIGSLLKIKREGCGLTQRDIAEQLGYTTAQFVSNWERGLIVPPMDALRALVFLKVVTARELISTLIIEVEKTLHRELLAKKSS